jgi:nicotinamidase-related amidase
MPNLPRSLELSSKDDTRLLIVDMQEKFVPVIDEIDRVIENCVKLLKGASILGVPAGTTEQYPKGLGNTIPEIAEHLGEDIPEKLEFSCLNALDWAERSDDSEDRSRVIVAGIETHVCIQQTTLDLLAHGFRVYIPVDAVSSRKPLDREIALQRMADSGAVLTTTEAILFELCQTAAAAEFKEISRLVK